VGIWPCLVSGVHGPVMRGLGNGRVAAVCTRIGCESLSEGLHIIIPLVGFFEPSGGIRAEAFAPPEDQSLLSTAGPSIAVSSLVPSADPSGSLG
jgi:hypothetical protein